MVQKGDGREGREESSSTRLGGMPHLQLTLWGRRPVACSTGALGILSRHLGKGLRQFSSSRGCGCAELAVVGKPRRWHIQGGGGSEGQASKQEEDGGTDGKPAWQNQAGTIACSFRTFSGGGSSKFLPFNFEKGNVGLISIVLDESMMDTPGISRSLTQGPLGCFCGFVLGVFGRHRSSEGRENAGTPETQGGCVSSVPRFGRGTSRTGLFGLRGSIGIRPGVCGMFTPIPAAQGREHQTWCRGSCYES